MPTVYKNLGQSNPVSGTLTTLYTVPSATSTVCSSISVCNQGSTDTTFRVSVAIGGAADTTAQYLYYDMAISAKDTFIATIGITLATTDIIRVYSGNSLLSFLLFGSELT